MMSKPKIIICFGHTQTGKSSFIKLNTGIQSIKCGQFALGGSTTTEIKAYKDVNKKHAGLKNDYIYIDSIGLGDNSLRYNLKQFNNHIEMNLLQLSTEMNICQISAIVITESYFASSFTLTLIVQQITEIFGYCPKDSIIVLGTKRNTAPAQNFADLRKNQLLAIMDNFSIPRNQFIDYYTPCPELNFTVIPPGQFTLFENAVSRCKPVKMVSIHQKQEKIKARAIEIQKQDTKQKAIKVEEQRVRYRAQKRTKTIQMPREAKRGGIAGLLGGTKVVWDTKQIEEIYQVPETYKVQIQKYIPDPPPYELCYLKAFREFEQQNLARLGSLIQ